MLRRAVRRAVPSSERAATAKRAALAGLLMLGLRRGAGAGSSTGDFRQQPVHIAQVGEVLHKAARQDNRVTEQYSQYARKAAPRLLSMLADFGDRNLVSVFTTGRDRKEVLLRADHLLAAYGKERGGTSSGVADGRGKLGREKAVDGWQEEMGDEGQSGRRRSSSRIGSDADPVRGLDGSEEGQHRRKRQHSEQWHSHPRRSHSRELGAAVAPEEAARKLDTGKDNGGGEEQDAAKRRRRHSSGDRHTPELQQLPAATKPGVHRRSPSDKPVRRRGGSRTCSPSSHRRRTGGRSRSPGSTRDMAPSASKRAAAGTPTAAGAAVPTAPHSGGGGNGSLHFWDPVWRLERQCNQRLVARGPLPLAALLALIDVPPELRPPTLDMQTGFLRRRPHLFDLRPGHVSAVPGGEPFLQYKRDLLQYLADSLAGGPPRVDLEQLRMVRPPPDLPGAVAHMGPRRLVQTFLRNEVWTLMGPRTYSEYGLRTAELRPFAAPPGDSRAPCFPPVCRKFCGTAASCPKEAACPFSHAMPRTFE